MNLGRAISLTNVQAMDYEPKAGGSRQVDLTNWEDVMGFVGGLDYPLQCLGMYCLTGDDAERVKLAKYLVKELGMNEFNARSKCEQEIDAVLNEEGESVCDDAYRKIAEWHAEFLFKMGWELD
jgi:hypothetical protein